jgi:hypothetical protein
MDRSMTRWKRWWKQRTDPVFSLSVRLSVVQVARQVGKPEAKADGYWLLSTEVKHDNDDANDNGNINSNINANVNTNTNANDNVIITMTKPTSTATSIIL